MVMTDGVSANLEGIGHLEFKSQVVPQETLGALVCPQGVLDLPYRDFQ